AVQKANHLDYSTARKEKAINELHKHKDTLRKEVNVQLKHLQEALDDVENILKFQFNYQESKNGSATEETQGSAISLESEPLKPKVDDCVIKWDPSNPIHAALKSVFKMEHIPIIRGTQEIDVSKIKHVELKNQPILDFDLPKTSSKDDAVMEIAKKVVKFKEDIERALKLHLTDALFDMLAWTYLPASLTKIGLAKDFDIEIAKYPVEKR
ncbi:hypothetical protein BGZ83_005108, partial [Gryganskiella cystojenkinii]